jgi:serine/threonine protein kinase
VHLGPGYSSLLVEFLSACLKVDVDLRISIEDLVSHPWIIQFTNPDAQKQFRDWINLNEKKREEEQASLKRVPVSLLEIGVERVGN